MDESLYRATNKDLDQCEFAHQIPQRSRQILQRARLSLLERVNAPQGSSGAEAMSITWWQKTRDGFRAAIEERNRSKVGRMARLKARAQKSLTSVAEAL